MGASSPSAEGREARGVRHERRRERTAATDDLQAHISESSYLVAGREDHVVSFHRPHDFDVYLINADGSGQRNLTRVWGLDDPLPVWTPDGQKIAFASKRDGNWELYVMNADGRGRRNLSRNAANDTSHGAVPGRRTGGSSSLAPDRNARTAAATPVYVINADGSGAAVPDTRAGQPGWSPDGRKISFTSKREYWAEIYVMNPDGSGQQRLTRSPARTVNARTVNDSPVRSPAQK